MKQKFNELTNYGTDKPKMIVKETLLNDHYFFATKEALNGETLIEALELPYLKLNDKLQSLKYTKSFLEIAQVSEERFKSESFEQLCYYNPLIAFCIDLYNKALMDGLKKVDEIEIEKRIIFVSCIPIIAQNIVYIIIEDRTLQREFEELLTFQHQLETASHIAAGVAHELRNPLSVIKGFLQLANLTNDYDKYYETVISEIDRMNGIIGDFLSLSKRKSERSRQRPIEVLNSLINIMEAECSLHNVCLKVELAETEKFINVNESQLKQVILNLLHNAVESYQDVHKQKILRIESKITDGQYVLYFKDNGSGIPSEILRQLEKPFFTTKVTGTGVGIPICKKIIEDHGGDFKIKSTHNVGTTIIITLPLEG